MMQNNPSLRQPLLSVDEKAKISSKQLISIRIDSVSSNRSQPLNGLPNVLFLELSIFLSYVEIAHLAQTSSKSNLLLWSDANLKKILPAIKRLKSKMYRSLVAFNYDRSKLMYSLNILISKIQINNNEDYNIWHHSLISTVESLAVEVENFEAASFSQLRMPLDRISVHLDHFNKTISISSTVKNSPLAKFIMLFTLCFPLLGLYVGELIANISLKRNEDKSSTIWNASVILGVAIGCMIGSLFSYCFYWCTLGQHRNSLRKSLQHSITEFEIVDAEVKKIECIEGKKEEFLNRYMKVRDLSTIRQDLLFLKRRKVVTGNNCDIDSTFKLSI